MRVSIIIPTYNVEAYITECLESVARQTYQGEMECLIVDDCGTDNSILLSERFILSYQGHITFKIIHHEHNRGLSAARNTGVDAATGDYIYFLDSDDAIIPDTIEEMVKIVKEYPKVEMIQGGITLTDGKAYEDFTKRDLPIYINDISWITHNILFHLPRSSWNRLLKKDFLLDERIRFHEGIIYEDVPYCYQLSLKCQHIGFLKKNTYIYRFNRNGSITNNSKELLSLQSRIIIIHDFISYYSNHTFAAKTSKDSALKALWQKWLLYMTIHSVDTLYRYNRDIELLSEQLVVITPFPWKILSAFYKILPLKIRHTSAFMKLFNLCTKI